jgi:hypothetical protein
VPFEGVVRSFTKRIWTRLGKCMPGPGHTPATIPARVSRDWVAVFSDMSPALPEMYRELLAQHGIPSVVYGSAIGSGTLGAIPANVRLLVPADRVAEARALLSAGDPDEADEADGEHERMVDRGER